MITYCSWDHTLTLSAFLLLLGPYINYTLTCTYHSKYLLFIGNFQFYIWYHGRHNLDVTNLHSEFKKLLLYILNCIFPLGAFPRASHGKTDTYCHSHWLYPALSQQSKALIATPIDTPKRSAKIKSSLSYGRWSALFPATLLPDCVTQHL